MIAEYGAGDTEAKKKTYSSKDEKQNKQTAKNFVKQNKRMIIIRIEKEEEAYTPAKEGWPETVLSQHLYQSIKS